MISRTIAATTHGRFLIEPPRRSGPVPILAGFHGYGEPAEAALERLVAIAPDGDWLLVAIQGLHRFYRGRTEHVVASWMTRQDRELAIQDNLQYVSGVVDALRDEWPIGRRVVFAGFSQGVAMAFRAGASTAMPVSVIACGGDIPPELGPAELGRLRSALIGRGSADQWYTAGKLDEDLARLRQAGVDAVSAVFEAGHEWAPPFVEAAAAFLRAQR